MCFITQQHGFMHIILIDISIIYYLINERSTRFGAQLFYIYMWIYVWIWMCEFVWRSIASSKTARRAFYYTHTFIYSSRHSRARIPQAQLLLCLARTCWYIYIYIYSCLPLTLPPPLRPTAAAATTTSSCTHSRKKKKKQRERVFCSHGARVLLLAACPRSPSVGTLSGHSSCPLHT